MTAVGLGAPSCPKFRAGTYRLKGLIYKGLQLSLPAIPPLVTVGRLEISNRRIKRRVFMEKMDKTSGQTHSFWLDKEELPRFDALSRNLACDVVIIGAGIAGLSTAYNALKTGLTVIVLEDGQVCSGETGRTSAHLANALDDRFYDLETYHGKEGARLAAESHSAAID